MTSLHTSVATLGFAIVVSGVASANYTLTTTSYAQNFNTLASTGLSSTLPDAGWKFSESGSNANATYGAGTGSDNAGNTYSFGAAGSGERAFGTLLSNTLQSRIGFGFVNATGSIINSLNIGYFGEQWRLGAAGRVDNLNFEYSTNATSLTTGTWTGVGSLNFQTLQTTLVGATNGNAVREARNGVIGGLNIQLGQVVHFRWVDVDFVPGADDGLGVDDFQFTAGLAPEAVPLPASSIALLTTLIAGIPLALIGRRIL